MPVAVVAGNRMPVAMVVVMDQAYIPDFLTAFANSRLRIQTTQEHWQHVQGIRPSTTEDSSAPGTAGPFGGGEGAMRPPTAVGANPNEETPPRPVSARTRGRLQELGREHARLLLHR